jgi:hypothetical protein
MEGKFLGELHRHYNLYNSELTYTERKAIWDLVSTLMVSLAYRASESGVASNKKGKSAVGSAESLFFHIFDHLFSDSMQNSSPDAFVGDLNRETAFPEVVEDWAAKWEGAEEAIEVVVQALNRIQLLGESPDKSDSPLKDVYPLLTLWITLGFTNTTCFAYISSFGYFASAGRRVCGGMPRVLRLGRGTHSRRNS